MAILACVRSFITIVALGIEPSVQEILDFPLRIEPVSNLTAIISKADVYCSSAQVERSHKRGSAQLRSLRFQTACQYPVLSVRKKRTHANGLPLRP
jgi:hypothetical protein